MAEHKIIKCSKFAVTLMLLCIKNCSADVESVKPFRLIDFEQMKSNIFTANISKELGNLAAMENNSKCVQELSAIGNGLINMELWAMKSKTYSSL